MYTVSPAYISAIQSNNRKFSWSGTITTAGGASYNFTSLDIVEGSGYITRQCCSTDTLSFGGVYAAEAGVTLFNDEIDRYSLFGATLTLTFHLLVEDKVYEAVPMGSFIISEANRGRKTLEIKAYDAMLNLETSYSSSQTSGAPYNFLDLLAKACDVELAQSEDEIKELPNGSEILGVAADSDIETWRDLAHYLAQALGCFAHINRRGKLELRPFSDTPVRTITDTRRFSSSLSDFESRYTAVSFYDTANKSTKYVSTQTDDGLTMELGANPLLQYGLDEVKERRLKALLPVVEKLDFVPFEATTTGDPATEVGDVLIFSGGQADSAKKSIISSLTVNIGGTAELAGVGKNPKLTLAKTKTDKDLAGLTSQMSQSTLSTYRYINAKAFDIGTDALSVINLEFVTTKVTDCEFKATLLLDSVKAGTQLIITYILDDNSNDMFKPRQSCTGDSHILTLLYPLVDVAAGALHTLKVTLEASAGSAHIDSGSIIATVTGQGMGTQNRWDGRIKLSETLSKFTCDTLPTRALTSTTHIRRLSPLPAGPRDALSKVPLAAMTLAPLTGTNEELPAHLIIVRDVVDVEDAQKMTYSKRYVSTAGSFTLQQNYSLSSNYERRLDAGRMTSITVDTSEIRELTSFTFIPFKTSPFVPSNSCKFAVPELCTTTGTTIKPVTAGSTTITGQSVSVDTGGLCSYGIDTDILKTITDLEVDFG